MAQEAIEKRTISVEAPNKMQTHLLAIFLQPGSIFPSTYDMDKHDVCEET